MIDTSLSLVTREGSRTLRLLTLTSNPALTLTENKRGYYLGLGLSLSLH
jgi:hypothetical protein